MWKCCDITTSVSKGSRIRPLVPIFWTTWSTYLEFSKQLRFHLHADFYHIDHIDDFAMTSHIFMNFDFIFRNGKTNIFNIFTEWAIYKRRLCRWFCYDFITLEYSFVHTIAQAKCVQHCLCECVLHSWKSEKQFLVSEKQRRTSHLRHCVVV